MTYPEMRRITRFDALMGYLFGTLVCIIGILGAVLTVLKIVDFVLYPSQEAALLAVGAIIAMFAFLIIATAGWLLNDYYLNYEQIREGDRPLSDFRRAYRGGVVLFGAFVGMFATVFCVLGFMAGGASVNLAVLTAIFALLGAICYFFLDRD